MPIENTHFRTVSDQPRLEIRPPYILGGLPRLYGAAVALKPAQD